MNNIDSSKTDWRSLVLAYLHDPPDKALDIKGHEARARNYLTQVMSEDASKSDLELSKLEDIKASVEDRLPFCKHNTATGTGRVDFVNEKEEGYAFRIQHPLSGAARNLIDADGWGNDLSSDESVRVLLGKIRELDDRTKLFALWRFLPDMMSEKDPSIHLLPADTRAPDHTIWNHLDLTAAFKCALSDNQGGALLSFTLGPVQRFIEQAKSLRDLWSGSYIISWLTFQAILPVIECCGPSSIIFPGLRENSLCDWWMKKEFKEQPPFNELLNQQKPNHLLIGSLPNTFLALIPLSLSKDLTKTVEKRCRKGWTELSKKVREWLRFKWGVDTDWDKGWDEQIKGFWDIRTSVLPFRSGGKSAGGELKTHFEDLLWKDCWPKREVKDLLDALKEAKDLYGNENIPPGSWAMHVELSQRVMAASKQIRHIPPHTTVGGDRPKCTLMGSLEQMGPGENERAQREFWESVSKKSLEGTHVRRSERLSAVALVKRFCWPCFFAPKLGLKPGDLRYSDTATIAAAEWLDACKLYPAQLREDHVDWSGQWIYQNPKSWEENTKDDDRDPPPPTKVRKILKEAQARKDVEQPRPYYSIMVLDGDEMGKWLRGDLAPKLREAYHPKIAAHMEKLGPKAKKALDDGLRPLSPALHAALTGALGNYARYVVRDIVEKNHKGELVYAGGDDVLAITPTSDAIECLRKLRENYRQDWLEKDGRAMTLMGGKATVSAGLVVAHYKSDLRDALEAAREAERAAKTAGRDALGISVMKRSGEHFTVVCPWPFAEKIEKLVEAFRNGASDRWAYSLRVEAETLVILEDAGIKSVIKRTVNHSEDKTKEELETALDGDTAGDAIANLFEEFRKATESAGSKEAEQARKKHFSAPLKEFVMLVQTASFLARGRDQ